MSEEDLKRMGVLLPEEKRGKLELVSTLSKPFLIFLFITVILSSVMMYIGDGSWVTWIGALVFIVLLILFTVHALRSIDRHKNFLERTLDSDNVGGDN